MFVDKILLRKNLKIFVTRDLDPQSKLLMLLRSTKYKKFKSILIYCGMKSTTKNISFFLQQNRFKVAFYSSDLNEKRRLDIQAEFMSEKI